MPTDERRALHELNNLLTVIRGFAEVVLADLPDDDRHRSDLRAVCRAAERAAEIGRELLERTPDVPNTGGLPG